MTRDRAGRTDVVTANVLQGEHRDAVWQRIVAAMQNFRECDKQTPRTRPVLALGPRNREHRRSTQGVNGDRGREPPSHVEVG